MEELFALLKVLQDLLDGALQKKNAKIAELTKKVAEVWGLYEASLEEIKSLRSEDEAEDAGFLAQINQATEGKATADQALTDHQSAKSAEEARLSATLSEIVAKVQAANADSVEAAQPSEPTTEPGQEVPLEPATETEQF